MSSDLNPQESPTPDERSERLKSFLPVSEVMRAEEAQRLEYWRNAIPEEHGEVLRQCLLLADAIGYDIKNEPLPQFPPTSKQSAS